MATRRRSPIRRALALAGLGLAAASVAGAGGARDLHADLRARGLPPEVAAPMEIDDEARAWARNRVPRFVNAHNRLESLLLALIGREEAPMVYTAGVSRSAMEAWRDGKANCLTFSHLYIALAREIGLAAYYLRVRDLASYERDGDLVVASDHVTAAFGLPQDRIVLDFSPQEVRNYRLVEPLTDLAALALHYSNLGAERIRVGEHEEARRLLDLAIRIEPEVADGWLNLGVVRRRTGDLAGAEAAYRRALETDPDLVSGYQNLSAVLDMLGRRSEADEILQLALRAGNRNPYSFLALGDIALRDGRIEDAEGLYRRARRLAPANAEPEAALGQIALARGRPREARVFLQKAVRLDASNPRVVALAGRLSHRPGPV
jgi:tetratricopeptide (TPR) repeat protein